MDKSALVDKIKFLEGLTNDEKADLIGLLRSHKKYGLVWEEKAEDVEERLREQLPVLNEVKERAIVSDDADAPNHILIEGDNLEALTALSYSHEGKIDVIYIDPPYNTGKDEFKYNDNYVDSEDEYRFSKWLSFMNKRLRIAKKLLSDKGVLIVSIDDYSFAQLKLLLDDIFDTSSNPNTTRFISSLIWNKQHSQQQGTFKRYHEYIYIYAKNKQNIKNVLTKGEGTIEAGAMKKISSKNPASSFTFPAGTTFEAKDGTCLQGTYGDSEKVTVENGILLAKDGKTVYPVTLRAGWTQKKQMESWFSGKETFDTKGQLVLEFYFNSTGKIKCRKSREAITPCTILPLYGMGSEQTEHLDNILNKKDMFSNPKPVEMIKDFISWFCPKKGICLDFFAGSGTTLESTIQLNEDGGNRQCILVTNNENKICEEVTYERNKRVINGYTTPKGEHIEGLKRNTLRYYQTELLPREHSPKNMRELMSKATDLLCIKEDLYTEQPMFGRYKTHPKALRYFADAQKQMLILYREEFIPEIVEEIKGMDFGGKKLKIYLYSPGHYAFEDDFFEVQDKVELIALPSAIYKAYKEVLPKAKDKLIELANEETTEGGTL